MNLSSLITRIIFVFIISIILFIGVFIGTYYYENSKLTKKISNKYLSISLYLRDNRLEKNDVINYVESLDYKVVQKLDVVENILSSDFVSSGAGFEVFKYENKFYFHVLGPNFRLLFTDPKVYSLEYYSFAILTIVFIVFISFFLWILNALKSLKSLKNNIQSFSNGNLEIDCSSKKDDEIAQVANEFDKAVKKIALLLNSRQLFLRTVMHELKTPIAKGRIVCELLDDDKQKNRMVSIFDKLNFLINDFAKIEEVVSKNYSINKAPIKLLAVVNSSIDMLLLDNLSNSVFVGNISHKKINVDTELFSMALKNLLDNGIKYSSNKKVIIEERNNTLCIESIGPKLQKPLEEYFKAYHNDTKSKNHGMGLGLHLVHEILKMHNLTLNYEYKNEKNIFKIELL